MKMRLLDTSSMTSIERQDDNMYAGEREPKYCILSYTWGRFQLLNPTVKQSCLQVHSIPWSIPAIQDVHFTAEDFYRVVKRISKSHRFAWIDIACIDQDNYAIKMDEVGRQAGIFANAEMAYIWLCRTPKAGLQKAVNIIIQYGILIAEAPMEDWRDWPETVVLARDAVTTILDDPWFSSLWTIQEGHLRTDAILLAREGISIDNIRLPIKKWTHVPNDTVTIGELRERLWLFYEILTQSRGHNLWRGVEELPANEILIEGRIHKAGYNCRPSANPNIQFASVNTREVSDEFDRIYAIMAVYNIRVGAAVPGAASSRDDYTLRGLGEEFALALNAKSVLVGQLFIHTTQPRQGKTWQITPECRVPDGFDMIGGGCQYYTHKNCKVTLTATKKEVTIVGSMCPLREICALWASGDMKDPWHSAGKLTFAQLCVDDYLADANSTVIPRFKPREEGRETAANVDAIVTGLVTVYGEENISVLRIGSMDHRNDHPYGYDYGTAFVYGLILLHDKEARAKCQRIGIVRWGGYGAWEESVHEPAWLDFEGIFL
ncbi:hypothetical protein N0V82_000152 [Gnomoniopsis sp. IMI 355080]|nr:hypothetical protein N0V82_000152 [Gnomoniopsis sp. IMI 355080]